MGADCSITSCTCVIPSPLDCSGWISSCFCAGVMMFQARRTLDSWRSAKRPQKNSNMSLAARRQNVSKTTKNISHVAFFVFSRPRIKNINGSTQTTVTAPRRTIPPMQSDPRMSHKAHNWCVQCRDLILAESGCEPSWADSCCTPPLARSHSDEVVHTNCSSH